MDLTMQDKSSSMDSAFLDIQDGSSFVDAPDEKVKYPCTLCFNNDKQIQKANYFCGECDPFGHYFCKKCLGFHRTLTDHTTVQSIAAARETGSLKSIRQELETANENLKKTQQELVEKNTKLGELETERENLKKAKQELVEKNTELTKAGQHLWSSHQELETEREKLKKAKQELDVKNIELCDLTSIRQELETERENLQKAKQELVVKNTELCDLTSIRQELETERENLKKAKQELDVKNTELCDLTSIRQELETERENLQKAKQELVEKNTELQESLLQQAQVQQQTLSSTLQGQDQGAINSEEQENASEIKDATGQDGKAEVKGTAQSHRKILTRAMLKAKRAGVKAYIIFRRIK